MRRLDPRTKLILAFLAVAAIALSGRLVTNSGLLGFSVIVIVWLRAMRAYLRWLAVVLPMAVFFGVVSGLGCGAACGLLAGLKLLGITTIFFIFFNTTDADELGNALMRWGLPFEAAFVFSTAMQFVPIIGRKARRVLDAQRCRGIPMEAGWRILRHWPAFLVPLVLQCFQLAEEMAEAMAARGFGRPGRSSLRTFKWGAADWLAMGCGAVMLGLFVYFQA